jgi:hypothetical protein
VRWSRSSSPIEPFGRRSPLLRTDEIPAWDGQRLTWGVWV